MARSMVFGRSGLTIKKRTPDQVLTLAQPLRSTNRRCGAGHTNSPGSTRSVTSFVETFGRLNYQTPILLLRLRVRPHSQEKLCSFGAVSLAQPDRDTLLLRLLILRLLDRSR